MNIDNPIARITICALLFLGVGFLLTLIAAWGHNPFGAALIGLSAGVSGGLIGFLFGVPRSPKVEQRSNGDEIYTGNANLEEISDWLTKLILGASLVQAGTIFEKLQRLTEQLSVVLRKGEPFEAPDVAYGLMIGILLYFFVIGFVFVFLLSQTAILMTVTNVRTKINQARMRGMMEGKQEAEEEANELIDNALARMSSWH